MSAVVRVSHGGGHYAVHVGEGLLREAGALLQKNIKPDLCAIVTDENVARYHLNTLQAAFKREGIAHTAIVLPPGEQTKSFRQLEKLCNALLEAGVSRGSAVAALGGGVVGDLAGLAASLVHRGAPFVNCPTTLLSQVDASVGGKTAVNTPLGKNLAGTFWPPRLVISDTATLATLPERELRSGFAEVVKHAVIAGGPAFARLEGSGNPLGASLAETIVESVRIKARIVSADEREQGAREVLNLGHTFGHGLEAAAGYDGRAVCHGEAVAAGIMLAFAFAIEEGTAKESEARRVAAVLEKAGLPVALATLGIAATAQQLTAFMRRDKKAKGGKIRLVLPRAIGEVTVHEAVPTRLEEFLERRLK